MLFLLPDTGYLDANNYRPLKFVPEEPMRGWDVYAVQTGLKYAGEEPGQQDGDLRERTAGAIENFQKHHGLKVDIICGGITMAMISSVCAHRFNHHFALPEGIPYGHFERECSLLPPNYSARRQDGSRDLGIAQENSRFYSAAHAFDVRESGQELCQRVTDYHAKYVSWGLTDNLAWRYACGSWNAPAWTDTLADGGSLPLAEKDLILAYIESVIAYSDL